MCDVRSDDYDDPELAYWIARALSSGSNLSYGMGLGQLLRGRGVEHVLCTMAGPCVTELALCDHGIKVFCTDSSAALLDLGRARADQMGVGEDRAQFLAARIPWSVGDLDLLDQVGPFDAVTCLGSSLIHLSFWDRLAFMVDCQVTLLRPGGWFICDNKRWTADLREERDPISVYVVTGPDDERPNRVLAVTHSYPQPGEQTYHLLLFDSISCSCVGQWELHGHPVASERLLSELRQAGFATPERASRDAAVRQLHRRYDVIEAQKPV